MIHEMYKNNGNTLVLEIDKWSFIVEHQQRIVFSFWVSKRISNAFQSRFES